MDGEAVNRERESRSRNSWTAVLLGLVLVAAGCGQERSAEAYCDAFWDKAIPLHEQYDDAAKRAEDNPFDAIMNLFSAPRDLAVVFDSMAQSAPEEIRADTEAVRDSFDKLADSYGDTLKDPLGGLIGNLGSALSVGNAMARVDAYMTQHCGTPQDAMAERAG